MTTTGPRAAGTLGRHRHTGQEGVGVVELALVLVVVVIVGALLYTYLASTARTVATVQEQRPLAQARLAADRATLTAIRSALQIYYAQHGQWPPTKDAVAGLLNPPPGFQCGANDYAYDPATGAVNLLIEDPARC